MLLEPLQETVGAGAGEDGRYVLHDGYLPRTEEARGWAAAAYAALQDRRGENGTATAEIHHWHVRLRPPCEK